MVMNYSKIVSDWVNGFTERVRTTTGSKKTVFTYLDAVQRSVNLQTKLDAVLIDYVQYIETNPLKENDYFKYVQAYRNGKELDLKYFRHDVDKLKKYYAKADKDKKYNPFSLSNYKDYVLFMMLKLKGVYKDEYNDIFNVKIIENREYTPLSKTPSVLRGTLPFKVKEFDISRAYPTFIDRELGINRTEDVYGIIDKVTFNTLVNIHHQVKRTNIETVRSQLKPIYGNKVDEVITHERYNNKGRMFKDMVVYEAEAIRDFIFSNHIQNYVRLHDGIFVLENTKADLRAFKGVKFMVKQCVKPKTESTVKTFYSYNSENKLVTTPKQYADFFQQEDFIRGCEDGNDKLIIFQDTNNVVSPFNHKTETVKYLKSEINEEFTDDVENRIARENTSAINQGYLLLPSKKIEYYTDKAKQFGLPFKNGFFKYNADKNAELLQLEYKDVDGFFAPHRTQKHKFIECSECSEFEVFITMISIGKDPRKENLTNDETVTLHNFFNMFGYLCHTYKNHSFSPAIILSDDGANDLNRNGGRGKTIFVNALQQVQPSMLKGGNEFKPSYIHNFADLKSDTSIYILDDVQASFNYNDLYTNIVGSITCQRKGTEAIEIPFSKAPKFIITTNWAVRYDEAEASTNRRFFEYKFTDFFNINNTPIDVFGHTLFDDWDANEWNRFYNFVYLCSASYINSGLQRIPYDKNNDNYRAIYSNDVRLNEFERILKIVENQPNGFTASDFLNLYNAYDNPLKQEKLFSIKNIKKFINIYIAKHNLPIDYKQANRRWVNDNNLSIAV
jgi:hypothetical protein